MQSLFSFQGAVANDLRFLFPCSHIKKVVGSSGLEPPTSRLSGARSNHLSYEPTIGGDEEVRTPDPLLAKQVLSQLSYTPTRVLNSAICLKTTAPRFYSAALGLQN